MFDKIVDFLSGAVKTIAIIIGVLVVLSIIFIVFSMLFIKNFVQGIFSKMETTPRVVISETSLIREPNKGEPIGDATQSAQTDNVNQDARTDELGAADKNSLHIESVKNIASSEREF